MNKLIPFFLVFGACTSIEAPDPNVAMPDFTLIDSNENAASFDQEISPRNYLGSISGWYFGHGT